MEICSRAAGIFAYTLVLPKSAVSFYDYISCSTDEVLDDTEEKIPELDPRETVLHKPPISPEDKLMSQWFCFVQTADGKVVAVEHPPKENAEVVNFKKGIAAAFQANFKGTKEEEEEDTSSLHRSSYRFV